MPLVSGRKTGSQSQSAPHERLLSNTRPPAPQELSRDVPRPACGSVGPCSIGSCRSMADISGKSVLHPRMIESMYIFIFLLGFVGAFGIKQYIAQRSTNGAYGHAIGVSQPLVFVNISGQRPRVISSLPLRRQPVDVVSRWTSAGVKPEALALFARCLPKGARSALASAPSAATVFGQEACGMWHVLGDQKFAWGGGVEATQRTAQRSTEELPEPHSEICQHTKARSTQYSGTKQSSVPQ